jgi:hypothetical protein
MRTLLLPALFLALLCGIFYPAIGQPYTPGQSYFGLNNYIEYQPGSLPIIIAAPHGGTLMPVEIPDRNCTGCTYVLDANTEELARTMADAIEFRLGCRPHLIINRLHRRKLDANRDLAEAADGNALAEQAWHDFHHFIQAAKDTSAARSGRGFFIDLHGHGHTIQRLELGYLLFGSELALSDSVLNTPTYINYSSIRGLALNNLQGHTHAQLLRGPYSLGTLFEENLYPAVPSAPAPFPGAGQPYFSGGYNTERHGSIDGGPVDAVQIECNFTGVRQSAAARFAFAQAAAEVLETFLQQYYFGAEFPGNACAGISPVSDNTAMRLRWGPNPTADVFDISLPAIGAEPWSVTLHDAWGRALRVPLSQMPGNIQLDLSGLPAGLYVFQIRSGAQTWQGRVIKM